MPAGFVSTSPTRDVTVFDVDPADFNHIILSSHTAWNSAGTEGLLESQDGAMTWIAHQPWAGLGSSVGTWLVHFLHDPASGQGNASTWLVGEANFWRTSNSGANWTKITLSGVNNGITHGGGDLYYAANGTVYVGANPYPIRSTDNGVTWQQLTRTPYASYYSIHGDGTTLYTQVSFTGTNNGSTNGLGVTPRPYLSSAESDGLTWSPYQSGKQTFLDGPYHMVFDRRNRIMYSSNWDAGLWALKVLP